MSSEMKAILFCLHCNKETEHTINYIGNIISSIRCEKCGTEIEVKKETLIGTYTEDFINRIITKPHRMTKELESDLTSFLISLPIRIITKPYRLLGEVKEIAKLKKNKEDK